MNRNILLASVFALILALAFSTASLAQPKADTPTDYFGVKLAPGNYHRIVTLAPNLTENLCFLGAFNRIVGVTNYDTYPPEVAGLARVGGFVDPDLESIIVLNPDLVLAYRGNPLPAISKLKELGLRVFVLDSPQTLDELCRQTIMLAALLKVDKKHLTLAQGLSKRIAETRRRAQALPRKPRVMMLIAGLQPPYYAAGSGTYIDDLISTAGGANPFASKGFAPVTPEAFLACDPEFLIIPEPADISGFRVKVQRAFREQPSLASTTAVKKGQLIFIEEDIISRPAPRIIHALAAVQEAITQAAGINGQA
jgi:iron complex transport system substrate-binding protein